MNFKRKRIISLFLAVIMMLSVVYTTTFISFGASNDYTNWKQYDSAWGYEKLWPGAQYENMAGGGCWITSVAMLLRHYNVVSDSNVNSFNPLVCCKRLMSYGIINSNGDFTNLHLMNQAYPGFTYAGSVGYSYNNLMSLYKQGYACIVHETRGHYVALRSFASDGRTIVMDPGYDTVSLTDSDTIQYFKISTTGSHTCNKGQYVYFTNGHPHHSCYKCSICNKIWVDYSSSNYYKDCATCNQVNNASITISGQNAPTHLDVGQVYIIKGAISSGTPLSKVTVGVFDQESGGTMKTGRTVSPNSNSYNVANVDAYVEFNYLPAGTYYYRITASNSSGTKVLLNQKFTVGNVSTDVHTCNKGQYVYFTKSHPHPSCYKCSVCGKIWVDNTSTNYYVDCETCNPKAPTNAKVVTEKSIYKVGEKVVISPSATGAVKYNYTIYYGFEGGEIVYSNYNGLTGNLVFTPQKEGKYIVVVSCIDSRNNYVDAKAAFNVEPFGIQVHFPHKLNYTQGQFSDVPAKQWFTENVANAVEFGLMKGNSASTFNPYGDVTIAEAVTMASRIHSIYNTGLENFGTTDGAWYKPYMDYAYNNGIISSAMYNINVNQKATRVQFAEIFAKALPDDALSKINNVSDNAIPDVKTTDASGSYVYKLYRAGILAGGDAKGTFSPYTYITRAECATIVSRMADSDNRISFSLQ